MTDSAPGSGPYAGESDEERQQRITQEIQFAQQRVIIEILHEWHGRPVQEVEVVLRRALEGAGLPEAPWPWIRSVASEIAEDRLYVVAKGAVPADYFGDESAQRAQDRVAQHGPSSSADGRGAGPGDSRDDKSAEGGSRDDESSEGFALPTKG